MIISNIRRGIRAIQKRLISMRHTMRHTLVSQDHSVGRECAVSSKRSGSDPSDEPFSTFAEWHSGNDERAYRDL
jgi:hypothetical protein